MDLDGGVIHNEGHLKGVGPEIKTFLGPEMGTRVVMSTISKRKHVLISKLIIGTKTKRFHLVRIQSERKQNILIWSKIIVIASRLFLFWPKNFGTKQSNLI
jgi:hypothetical protein